MTVARAHDFARRGLTPKDPARIDLRAQVAGMTAAEGLAWCLDYFDFLFPKPPAVWRLAGVDLSPQELRLLRRLWMGGGAVVPLEHLAGAVWGDRLPYDWPDSHLIPVVISGLRGKLGARGVVIRSERTVGYALTAPAGFVWQWERVA